jgi:DNA-binding transcriptional LysR family regulator
MLEKCMVNDRLKNITMQQMETLIALVEKRSFSRAAKKMFLSQPALTKNIGNMEACLGTLVVNRSNQGISLTTAGKIIYDYAQRIIKLRNEATEKIHRLDENTGGDIYLGASTIPATYILPRPLSLFRKKHPDICVHVQAADSEETINMVLDKEKEMGIIGKEPHNKKLIAQPLWQDQLILIIPPSHRWCKKKIITTKELLVEPFVIRERGSATREILDTYLKDTHSINSGQLNVCSEMGSSEAIKEAVIAGLGVSVISIHAVARELTQKMLHTVSLPGCAITRHFYLIYQHRLEFTSLNKVFVDFLKRYEPKNTGASSLAL